MSVLISGKIPRGIESIPQGIGLAIPGIKTSKLASSSSRLHTRIRFFDQPGQYWYWAGFRSGLTRTERTGVVAFLPSITENQRFEARVRLRLVAQALSLPEIIKAAVRSPVFGPYDYQDKAVFPRRV